MRLIGHYLSGGRCKWTCDHPDVRLSLRMDKQFEVWLVSLRVDEEVRGIGIGSQVMRTIIREFGKCPIYLYALADYRRQQAGLERWYRRYGFRAFGPQARCKYSGALLMRRIPS